MIDREKRKEELENLYPGDCDDWAIQDFFDEIISQEQSMMENLVKELKRQFSHWVRYEEDKDELFELFDLCISEMNLNKNESMIEKLEADKAEAYNKGYADGYSDTYDYYNNPNSEKFNTIQEKLKKE